MSTTNHPSTFPVILFISHSSPVVTSPVWGFSEKLLAKEDAGLYDFINQGCLDVDGMDDKEEMKGTDVCKIQSLESSFVILLVDTKEMTQILIMHSHTTQSIGVRNATSTQKGLCVHHPHKYHLPRISRTRDSNLNRHVCEICGALDTELITCINDYSRSRFQV